MTQWRTQTSTFSQSAPIDPSADSFQRGLFIGGNPSGTKLYHSDGNNLIYEYDLTTPYDISTMSSTFTNSFDPSPQFAGGEGTRSMWFTPDGLKMFVLASFRVYEYDLSIAWNVTTAVFNQLKNLSSQDTFMTSIYFREDGLLMFTLGKGNSGEGSNDRVYKYDLSTPYDLSTVTFTSLKGSFHVTENQPNGLFFEDNGLRMYILGEEGVFGDTLWEYPLTNAWDITSATSPSELDIESQDSSVTGLHFLNTDPNRGARFWHGGIVNDRIYEYTMAQIGVEKEFTINAILTLEFVEVEVGAKVVNRFDTGGALQVGARLVLFCDNIETNTGWLVNNGGGQIFIDDPTFPNVIHLEELAGGVSVTERWARKDIGVNVSGDTKLEFSYDFQAMNGSNTARMSIYLQEQNVHPDVSTGSQIGCELDQTTDNTHHLFGRVTDGISTANTIQGGTHNQRTTHIYPPNQPGGVDAELLGERFVTVELKDGKLRISHFKDESRTIHARGSPREVDATGINPTNLRFIVIGNSKISASARRFTGDIDDIYVTQNEPLSPLAINTSVQTLIEDWESYGAGSQNPDGWLSAVDTTSILLTDIREVSFDQPNGGLKSFKLQHQATHNGVIDSSVSSSVIGKRALTPANPDGGELLIPYAFTAEARSNIMSPALNTSSFTRGGVYIRYEILQGAPSDIQTNDGLAFRMFEGAGSGSSPNSINALNDLTSLFTTVDNIPPDVDNPDGSYIRLKSKINTPFQDSSVFDGRGWDFESHVKSITIGYWIDSFATSAPAGNLEALMFGDEINLIPDFIQFKDFFVNALVKAQGVLTAPDQGQVNAILELTPGMVQLVPEISAVLIKLDQEKEFFISAQIGSFETEVFFSTTHFQDITPLVAGVGTEIKEFTVTGKVVIRTAVNSAIVSAFIKALGQEKEFSINGRLLDVVGITTDVSAFITGGQDIFLIMNAILKALNQEQEFIVDALVGDINIVEPTVDAFIQQQGNNFPPTIPQIDAILQTIGAEKEFEIDSQLVVPAPVIDAEFTINAILGLSEFESILDVESVIGSKTGSQT